MRKINFSDNVKKVFTGDKNYEHYSRLMFDSATNNLQGGITKETADNSIREMFFNALNIDMNASRKDLRRAIRRHITDVYDLTEETVENLIVTGWNENPFFENFVERKSAALGDTNEFWVEDDVILTVAEVSGNHHDLIRQKLGSGESFSVKLGYYGIKIYTDFELFLAGRIDWAGFIQKIYEALDKKINDMLYGAVMAAGDKVLPKSEFNATGALSSATRNTFMTLVENVQMVNDGEVVIMGTKSALSALSGITPIDWVSENMKNERYTTGKLGLFEGITLVEIPQRYKDGSLTDKLVDSSKLLIMPLKDNKFVKLYNEGDPQIKEVNDGATNRDSTIEFEYITKMGVATVVGRKFGVWTITQ